MAPPPQEESKITDPVASPAPAEQSTESANNEPPAGDVSGDPAPTSKKKKSKKKKGKKPAAVTDAEAQNAVAEVMGSEVGKLPKGMVDQIIKQNPALASEFQGMDRAKIEKLLQGMKMEDVLTGMVSLTGSVGSTR